MPSYSNIFQPKTSFALEIVDLENEDKKKLPDGPRYLKLSNAKYILKCRMRVYQVIFILLAYVALP